jgi:5-methylcytosine-specific restriction endonuclease McrA
LPHPRYRQIYNSFLRSHIWKKFRQYALIQLGKKCANCGSTSWLQVHHRIYRVPLEDVVLEDVELLCEDCHDEHHGHRRKRRKREKIHYDRIQYNKRMRAEKAARIAIGKAKATR